MATPDSQTMAASSTEGDAIHLLQVGLTAPLHWLAAGWRDMQRAWSVSLFYGVCFWGMALVLGWVFNASPQYTMSIASGCLLVGPFLAMGLYDTSRRLELGLPPDLAQSITCWDKQLGSMGMLVFVLIVLELLWGRASLVVFAVFFNTGMPSTTGVLQAVFNPENWQFLLAYAVVGGVFAAVVFGSTVVALPLMLDRGTDALTAAITSFRVVFSQTGALLLWAALIVALVAGALAVPWQLPLIVVGPWLGCATWHAYRACIAPVSGLSATSEDGC
ncbi:DUF2189 domain-containing protein [Comamonas sp.]|uniref:DUF2189 domain-containing protein n=1 Tax=Comamonas sp. TaxID=34028 RepID=UPI003FA57F54